MRFLRPAVLALGLALGACHEPATPGEECDDLLDCVAIDLRDAIDVATEHVPGVVVDAELSDEDGDGPMSAKYDVDVFIGGDPAATREVTIDARTGDFDMNGFDPDDQDDGPLQAGEIEASPVGMTIWKAIELAEENQDGTAVSAELEVDANTIQVVVFHGEDRIVVTVDLATGDVSV